MLLFYMLIGSILYSFAHVVSIRLPRKMNFISDRSRCMNCHHILSFYDTVPVISYIALKGRCRYCHSKIDPALFYVEILGLLSGMIFYNRPLDLLYSMFLLIIALIDLESMSVYLVTLIPLLLICGIEYPSLNLYDHLIGMILFSVPMTLLNIVKKDSFGWGDVYLEMILGFHVGVGNLFVMSYTLFYSLIYSLFKRNRQNFPFIPFIYLGYMTNYVIQRLVLTS